MEGKLEVVREHDNEYNKILKLHPAELTEFKIREFQFENVTFLQQQIGYTDAQKLIGNSIAIDCNELKLIYI